MLGSISGQKGVQVISRSRCIKLYPRIACFCFVCFTGGKVLKSAAEPQNIGSVGAFKDHTVTMSTLKSPFVAWLYACLTNHSEITTNFKRQK